MTTTATTAIPAPGPAVPAPVLPLQVSAPTYLTSCLICGGPLGPVLSSPVHAPWVCPVCCHAWWVCELQARDGWERARRAFGWKARAGMEDGLKREMGEAVRRGCSVRSDQVGLLSVSQLEHLVKVSRHKAFVAEVEAVLKQKGGK